MKTLTNYLKHNRNPGWIELFFDLAYAVLLGRLAHMLFHTHHGHIEVANIISFLWIFAIQFMVWMLYTVYMNIYGNNSFWQSLFGFALMSCLFIVAMLMHDIRENASYISAAMGIMSLVIGFQYKKSVDVVISNKAYAKYKFKALMILGSISIAMVFAPSNWAIAIVFIIYAVEHLIDEIFLNKVGMAKPDGEHFVERIGIFIILLLGESFITLFANLPDEPNLTNIIPVGLMLIILFGMFINYFSHNERMAHAEYSRYSQILLYNYIVMAAITLLPVLIYHGIHQKMAVNDFKYLVILFISLFYFGNGLSYRRVSSNQSWIIIAYSIGFPVIFSTIIWFMTSYLQVLIALTSIIVFTGTTVLVSNHKISNQHSTKSKF